MTFPLIFEVSKPRERLQPGYKYLTQPEIAGIMIRKLRSRGLDLILSWRIVYMVKVVKIF